MYDSLLFYISQQTSNSNAATLLTFEPNSSRYKQLFSKLAEQYSKVSVPIRKYYNYQENKVAQPQLYLQKPLQRIKNLQRKYNNQVTPVSSEAQQKLSNSESVESSNKHCLITKDNKKKRDSKRRVRFVDEMLYEQYSRNCETTNASPRIQYSNSNDNNSLSEFATWLKDVVESNKLSVPSKKIADIAKSGILKKLGKSKIANEFLLNKSDCFNAERLASAVKESKTSRRHSTKRNGCGDDKRSNKIESNLNFNNENDGSVIKEREGLKFGNSFNWNNVQREDSFEKERAQHMIEKGLVVLALRRIRRFLFRVNPMDKPRPTTEVRIKRPSTPQEYVKKSKIDTGTVPKPKINTQDQRRKKVKEKKAQFKKIFTPSPKFSVGRLNRILERRCAVIMGGLKFAVTTKFPMVQVLCNEILDNVKLVLFKKPRHRVVINVVVIEAKEQSVTFASRCLWDTATDNYTSYNVKIKDMYILVSLHWVEK